MPEMQELSSSGLAEFQRVKKDETVMLRERRSLTECVRRPTVKCFVLVWESPAPSPSGVGRGSTRETARMLAPKVVMTNVFFHTDSSSDILEFLPCCTFSRASGGVAGRLV